MPANPTHHICPDCFYTWAHGQDGSHSCIQQLRRYKLPADVRLPGGMTISRGCELNTVLLALRHREAGEAWQTSFDAPIPVDGRLEKIIRSLPTQPLIQQADQPYQDPRNGEATWSANGEDWHNYDSVEEMIREETDDICSFALGDLVYVGSKRYQDPAGFVDHQKVLEDMGENARQSDAGEWVDGWPAPGADAEAELKEMLEAWARKHCPPDFYLVEEIRPYTITADDLERANAPVGIDSEGGSHD